MQIKRLIDSQGKVLALGREIGKGGEGIVYEVQNQPNIVAKIYLKTPDQNKADKICSMVRLGNEDLLKLSAWPRSYVQDHNGATVGFTMEKLVGYKPLFELYSPKLRLKSFPMADWRFLIHAAMNTARAFVVVHDMGHVIGDVNHGNLLVAQDATVKFIDTDSFQVSCNSQHWLCEVGVNTHQPPEMQCSSYKGIVRTPNQDNFGLAILVFQLLCLARHPFSGRFLGKGDMPIEKAIAEHRFAYSLDNQKTKMLPPPASIPIQALSPKVVELLEKAFSSDSSLGSNRPNGREWIAALEQLNAQLKQCKIHSGHFYFHSVSRCPWCDIEMQISSRLFPIVISVNYAGTSIDFSALFSRLKELANMAQAPELPDTNSIRARASEDVTKVKFMLKKYKKLFGWITCGLVIGFCVVNHLLVDSKYIDILNILLVTALPGILIIYYKIKQKITLSFSQAYKASKEKWLAIKSNWDMWTHQAAFDQALEKALLLKQKLDDLLEERQQRLQTLHNNRKGQQLNNYLDQFYWKVLNRSKIKAVMVFLLPISSWH